MKAPNGHRNRLVVLRQGDDRSEASPLFKGYAKLETIKVSANSIWLCPFSLWEKARMRETPAIAEHHESLTPTLSQRERE